LWVTNFSKAGFFKPALKLENIKTSLPEVGGHAVYYVDPLDATSIAKAIDDIAGDPPLQALLNETGVRQAAKFSSENKLASMIDAYKHAINPLKPASGNL